METRVDRRTLTMQLRHSPTSEPALEVTAPAGGSPALGRHDVGRAAGLRRQQHTWTTHARRRRSDG
jgi:hypothetical protein